MRVCALSYAFLPVIYHALKSRKRLFSAKRGLREPEILKISGDSLIYGIVS